eukprot:6044614-Prymnesium_polylepis.1
MQTRAALRKVCLPAAVARKSWCAAPSFRWLAEASGRPSYSRGADVGRTDAGRTRATFRNSPATGRGLMPAADCTMRSAVQKDVFRMEQRNLRTRHQSAAQCTRRASAAACSHTRPSVPSPRRRSRASANSTHLNRTGDRTTDHAAN